MSKENKEQLALDIKSVLDFLKSEKKDYMDECIVPPKKLDITIEFLERVLKLEKSKND